MERGFWVEGHFMGMVVDVAKKAVCNTLETFEVYCISKRWDPKESLVPDNRYLEA